MPSRYATPLAGRVVDAVQVGEHPGVDLVGVVDLRAVAGAFQDDDAGPGDQPRDAFRLPLRVEEEAPPAEDQVERGAEGAQFVVGEGLGGRAADAVGPDPGPHHGAQLRDDEDRLLQPGRQARAERRGGGGREEAHEDPGEEPQPHLLQPARVEQRRGGEAPGPPVRHVEGEPAAVRGADEVDAVEAEPGERLVQPLCGAFRLVERDAVHAAVGVAGGFERVDGALRGQRRGVRVPHGGAASGAVHQDDGGAGGGAVGGRGALLRPVPVDVRGPEGGLHVVLRAGGGAQRVDRVAGGEVAVAQGVVDVAADVGRGAGGGVGHGGTSWSLVFVVRPYHVGDTAVP